MNTLRSHIRKIISESYEESVLEVKMPLRRVAGALIKDVTTNKVLLLKRNDKTPRWAMMSGEVDEGEDALDGLEREMYEELFIRPGSVRLNFVGVEHIPAKNIDLYYYEGFVKNQFKPHLDEENLDYGWFSLEDLPSPLFGGLYGKISHILDKDNVYSDVKQINEIRKEVRTIMESIFNEKFNVYQNILQISEPYDKIQKHKIGNKVVYVLFGDVDYYQNKESIKAIKRKSDEVDLDSDSYKSFLQEFKRRFYSIPELMNSDVVVSIDTTSVVTSEMAEVVGKSYINSGFKKQDTMFKMQDVDLDKRLGISGIFNKSFDHLEEERICVIDDFITTGTSFKNAFDTLPNDVEAVGVCLFRLKS